MPFLLRQRTKSDKATVLVGVVKLTVKRRTKITRHTYSDIDRAPKDPKTAKRALKKNLEFGRRWSILVDGYVEGNIVVPGLGLGVLLLCGPYIKKIMFIFRAFWESRTNKNLVTIRERSNYICS
jgi:hypothetical protein